jgi:hypothetical protein
MTLFRIERDISHLEGWERASLIPASISASLYYPLVRWLRTYVLLEEGGGTKGFCVYEAPGPEALAGHHLHCKLPFQRISEVEHLGGVDLQLPEPERSFAGDLFYAVVDGGIEGAAPLRSFRDLHTPRTHAIFGARAPAGASRIAIVHPSEWVEVYDSLSLPRHWELPAPPAG